MSFPTKGQKSLRSGRSSEPNARYFLTFCTNSNPVDLTRREFFIPLRTAFSQCESDKAIDLYAYAIMPDHVHTVIRLNSLLSLGKLVSKIKSSVSRANRPQLALWQRGFFDRKLRNDADFHPTLHYCYLNPYRKGLIEENQTWPYTYVSPEIWSWFKDTLNADCPYPEWLSK